MDNNYIYVKFPFCLTSFRKDGAAVSMLNPIGASKAFTVHHCPHSAPKILQSGFSAPKPLRAPEPRRRNLVSCLRNTFCIGLISFI